MRYVACFDSLVMFSEWVCGLGWMKVQVQVAVLCACVGVAYARCGSFLTPPFGKRIPPPELQKRKIGLAKVQCDEAGANFCRLHDEWGHNQIIAYSRNFGMARGLPIPTLADPVMCEHVRGWHQAAPMLSISPERLGCCHGQDQARGVISLQPLPTARLARSPCAA